MCEGIRGGTEVSSFAFHLRKLFRLGMFASYFSSIPFAIAIICGSLSAVSSFEEVLQFVSAFARILAENLLLAKVRAKCKLVTFNL